MTTTLPGAGLPSKSKRIGDSSNTVQQNLCFRRAQPVFGHRPAVTHGKSPSQRNSFRHDPAAVDTILTLAAN